MGDFDLMDYVGFNFVFGNNGKDKGKSRPTPPAPPTPPEKPKK